MASSLDNNPRPLKRQRTSPAPMYAKGSVVETLTPTTLLLSLPSLLVHPPTHRQHARSLFLSLFALRKCLSSQNLDVDAECRAWTGLGEVGFRIGLKEPGIEHEVEKAITKALLIAQKHPSLRPYKVHLTLLSAQLSEYQNNTKFAQNTIRRLLTTYLVPNDPPHILYAAHLGLIASLSTLDKSGVLLPSIKSLSSIQDLHELALKIGHQDIVKLVTILRLRTLIQMGSWSSIQNAVTDAETLLGLPSQDATMLSDSAASIAHMQRSTSDTVLLIHLLVLAVIFYTHTGDTPATLARLKILHEMLDGGGLDSFGPSGVIEISFPHSKPLYVQMTHPRVIYVLAFLISSVAKRDPVGRKPKRKVFASEGLIMVNKELKKDITVPTWASIDEIREIESRLNKMKADMMCEVIGVCIMRSEFGEAEKTLAELIAHTRTQRLFPAFSARIMLHQAQLAHALGQTTRALQCYQVAAYLSRKREGKISKSKSESAVEDDDDDEGVEDHWINVTARAGEVWVRIGVMRRESGDGKSKELEMEELRRTAEAVVNLCDGLGSTLGAIASVLRACLSNEFLKAKTHLRHALQIVTTSQDNHLRALVLSLIASQYLNTSTEHAEAMLATAEQLAAGLGAQPRKSKADKSQSHSQGSIAKDTGDGVGNAPLRLWIGERTLELQRRAGDDDAARKQEALNSRMREAVKKIEQRRPIGAVRS